MKLISLSYVFVAVISTTVAVNAQSAPNSAVSTSFCDPLMSEDRVELDDENEDDEVEYTQTYRYDLEVAEPLTTREQIMNVLFEEKWNFETSVPIKRHELCAAEENYVVLWAKLLQPTDSGKMNVDAEGFMSIRKDKSFKFVFAERPYLGTWELDGVEMVLTADWLNEGSPYRTPVEFVKTPVETVDGNGDEYNSVDEMYRMGGFRFYRIPTTVKGAQQNCSCKNLGG